MIKTIDSIQYHVWSDALHARQLAKQTESKWDRGAYVRWTIQTAWSAFENVCIEALETTGLGMRFKDRFDQAVAAKQLTPVDWGQGIWQQALLVYDDRKKFAHVVPSISHEQLLSPIDAADNAIRVLRDAIKAVLVLAGHPCPAWVNDDDDLGWNGPSGPKSSAHAIVVHAGVSEDDEQAIRIAYFMQGVEHICEIAPPGTDIVPLLDRLIRNVTVPICAVRAYKGKEILEHRDLNFR